MIILDTNIVSELMKTSPNPGLWRWLETIEDDPLLLTAITVAELRYGVSVLPKGKRRTQLDSEITAMVNEDFKERILSFDRPSAEAYGLLMARFKNAGRAISQSDGMIASIALINEASLVTRNTRDFEHCGLTLINPFLEQR